VGAEMLQSLSDDHIVDGHLVVREELDLHDNVSLVAQDGIGEIDFVQIIAQWVVADTATDVVAEVKRRFAENNIDDGWEQPMLFRRRGCEKVAPAGQFETDGGDPLTCPP
jgi:hypothetical protein